MITVYATSGSRGEQAMTLAIDVVKLASPMITVGLINFGIVEKILSIPRKDKEFLSIYQYRSAPDIRYRVIDKATSETDRYA
jgi:hypothetical protein